MISEVQLDWDIIALDQARADYLWQEYVEGLE